MNNAFLALKTKSHTKKNNTPRSSSAYEAVEKIGIIFTVEDLKKHNAVKALISNLEKDGKKAEVLTFLPKKHHNFEFKFNFFNDKDINFWGNFTSKEVLNFANKPFDYLFYIDEVSNPRIRNILAMSKAKCRISKRDPLNAPVSEMMIEVPSFSNEALIREMYRYTKILS